MPSLFEALLGAFTIVNLGAGGDADYALPDELLKTITLIEVDGGNQTIISTDKYHAKHRVNHVVAGSTQTRRFYQRAFWGTSSLLEVKKQTVARYGLESFFEVISATEIQTVTLTDILEQLQIKNVDFLKTDLEGLDFEIIHSSARYLDTMLALQCELRFDPVYEGEPYFHEAAQFLYDNDFELVGLKPEFWKANSPRRPFHMDGNLAWADCIFMKKADALAKLPTDERTLAHAKHIILAVLLGKKSYADWLLQQCQSSFPKDWVESFHALTLPNRTMKRALQQIKPGLIDILYVSPIWPWLRQWVRRPSHKRFTFEHISRTRDNVT
jgi:hypothetical protein